MKGAVLLVGVIGLQACGGAGAVMPAPPGPSAFSTCRNWSLRGDNDIFRTTCGETDVTVFTRSEPYRPNVEQVVFPQVIAERQDDDANFRSMTVQVPAGGEPHLALDMQSVRESHMFYSRVILQRDQDGQTLEIWCSRYDQPLGDDCGVVVNQLGATSDIRALQTALPQHPDSIERDRRRSLAACTPTNRVDTTVYGTLDRVTQLACDERTLFVGEEAGALNDETRDMAFERFRNAFGAINSWDATFDLNGVDHRGVHSARSEPDGSRVEGFIMLLPSGRDHHRLLVCIMPGDIDECGHLLEELATIPGTAGIFSPAVDAPVPPPAPPTTTPPATTPDTPAVPPARRHHH